MFRGFSKLAWFISGAAVILIVLAGILMLRWIDRAGEADRQQQIEYLDAAVESCRSDIQQSVLSVLSDFRPIPQSEENFAPTSYVAGLYTSWEGNTKNPQLIRTVAVATMNDAGGADYRVYQTDKRRFVKAAWPSSVALFGDILRRLWQRQGPLPVFQPGGYGLVVSGNAPVVIYPLMTLPRPGPPPGRGPGGRNFNGPPPGRGRMRSLRRAATFGPILSGAPSPSFGRGRAAARLSGWCFVELNLEYFQDRILPESMQRYFGRPGFESYWLAVVGKNPEELLFSNQPGLTLADFSKSDASASLISPDFHFGPGFLDFNTHLPGGVGMAPPPPGEDVPGMGAIRTAVSKALADGAFGGWQLVARHQAGSIDAVVQATRRRNLAIGLTILGLLAANTLLLLVSTQRARTLARRQMEFVAGVSHELYTPLAVIQSASFNLSKGLIQEEPRVRQYGAEIQQQGRRLQEMVQQILGFASIESGRQYDLKPTQVADVAAQALDECKEMFQAGNWTVERDIEAKLPLVSADDKALRNAIKNLISNALKYAGNGKWLGIHVHAANHRGRPEVEVTVEDRGPGIEAADLPHVFEPFYRGRKVAASSVPGAGLGLSLVKRDIEAQHGRITLDTTRKIGTAFTVHLPALKSSAQSGTPK